MQERRSSIANTLELHLPCTNPLIYNLWLIILTSSHPNRETYVVSSHKGPVIWSFDVCFIVIQTSCWTNNWVPIELRCHDAPVTPLWYFVSWSCNFPYPIMVGQYILTDLCQGEWEIRFNGLSKDSGHRGPSSPYKPCNQTKDIKNETQ